MSIVDSLSGRVRDQLPAYANGIAVVPTAITAFIGIAARGPLEAATPIAAFSDFERIFGGLKADCPLGYAVRDFFRNGGRDALIVRLNLGPGCERRALHALDAVELFNLLCIPSRTEGLGPHLIAEAAAYCEQRRAMLLLDPPPDWHSAAAAIANVDQLGTRSENAAVFFPMLRYPDPMRGGEPGDFAPCGAVAGMFARTDAQRGVWKAPAGMDATLAHATALSMALTDTENAQLSPLGINCLRSMPGAGSIVWGARTLRGGDSQALAWRYIPVRRTALFIEESLARSLRSLHDGGDAAALGEKMRLAAVAFMHALFLQGAFQGRTPDEAYFVRCERDDIATGAASIIAGFAPIKASEFIDIKLVTAPLN